MHTITVGTDSHGSQYTALDVGTWLTPNFGVRINAAHEDIHSYVDHTNGRRSFISLAADWKISDNATLQLDTDYQTSGQRSVSGYQLLGGTTLPPHPSSTQLLGYEPWQQPVGIHASNTTLRFNYRLSDNWSAQLSGSHSHSVIDDNVAYAYGCFYARRRVRDGATPGYFLRAQRRLRHLRLTAAPTTRAQNDEARAVLKGSFDIGNVGNEVSLGTSAFRRTLDQRPYVYDYVGTANISEFTPPYFAPSPNQPGPSARTLTSWQHAVFGLDRMHLASSGRCFWAAALCIWMSAPTINYRRASARHAPEQGAAAGRRDVGSRRAADALCQLQRKPFARRTQAPYWTSNGNDRAAAAAVTAGRSRREVRVERLRWISPPRCIAFSQPYQFAQPRQYRGRLHLRAGRRSRVHTGLELNADGRLTDNLRLTVEPQFHSGPAHMTPARPRTKAIRSSTCRVARSAVYLDYRLPFASQPQPARWLALCQRQSRHAQRPGQRTGV